MPERHLEWADVEELVPAPKNPKLHDLETLSASLDRFGYVEVIVEDERTGRLLSGHGRAEVPRTRLELRRADPGARNDDGTERYPVPEGVMEQDGKFFVQVLRGMRTADDAEAEALIIALNRIGERGSWDNQSLAEMLQHFTEADTSLEGIGYSPRDVDDLMALLQEAEIAFDPSGEGPAAKKESSYDDWADDYEQKQVRSLVLDYPLGEYNEVVRAAGLARAHYDVESNAG